MKRLCLCVVALVMGGFLVIYLGCDQAAKTTKTAIEAGEAIATDKLKQLEDDIKKGTTLVRLKKQLSDTKGKHKDLTELANKFYIDSEVALKKVQELKKAKEAYDENSKKLQVIAKNAGLPEKSTDVSEEDKTKTILVGTKNFTGEEVYRIFEAYKKQEEKANKGIERTEKLSNACKEAEKTVRSRLVSIDDDIEKMEDMIADFELYQRILAIQGSLGSALKDSFDRPVFKIDELLNTDSIMSEMQTELHRSEVLREDMEKQRRIIDLDGELSKISLSIINDDLL